MMSTLVTSHGISYGIISGYVDCPHCPARFLWSESKAVCIREEGEEMHIFGPGCPECRRVVPLGRFGLPLEDCAQVSSVAAKQHKPPRQKAAVVGVWGEKAGLLAAMSWPGGMADSVCGQRIDEFLVSEGWPARYGTTWIRAAVWNEAKERGGQMGERIMVHWDGKHMAWTPCSDWIVVAPQGLLEE